MIKSALHISKIDILKSPSDQKVAQIRYLSKHTSLKRLEIKHFDFFVHFIKNLLKPHLDTYTISISLSDQIF